MNQENLVFLKLGGSLITDKTRPLTPQLEIINRIAEEIVGAMDAAPDLKLVIGHGSGSFGHAVANQYQTQSGGFSDDYWDGFAKVWLAARLLNQIVIEKLSDAGLPVIAFPPSASTLSSNHTIREWDTAALELAVSHGLIPLLQGDVVFDSVLGGTIVSTEQVFQFLAARLRPSRILLAGLDRGVYLDAEKPEEVVKQITPTTFDTILPALTGAQAVDVTGGMLSKVSLMVELIAANPDLQIDIFSGIDPGNLYDALLGLHPGTLITV